ncbi:MAG: hypothetical protein Q7U05_01045 [Polaromonas sp.]|nr:hypothetical protein [Polaromonas sp.]
MAFTEDFSTFFNADEFAQKVTLGGVEVSALFDAAYALAGVGVYGMAGTQPMLTLATANVPADPIGLAVQVGSSVYTVAAHEPNGTGISVLQLELA